MLYPPNIEGDGELPPSKFSTFSLESVIQMHYILGER